MQFSDECSCSGPGQRIVDCILSLSSAGVRNRSQLLWWPFQWLLLLLFNQQQSTSAVQQSSGVVQTFSTRSTLSSLVVSVVTKNINTTHNNATIKQP